MSTREDRWGVRSCSTSLAICILRPAEELNVCVCVGSSTKNCENCGKAGKWAQYNTFILLLVAAGRRHCLARKLSRKVRGAARLPAVAHLCILLRLLMALCGFQLLQELFILLFATIIYTNLFV